MFQVYKITNNLNNQCYIGSSVEVERRWRQHKEASINEKDHHYDYPLMRAFRKFGIDNFTFEIIDSTENYSEMIQKEHDYIIKEDCIYPKGYNQTERTDSPMFDPEIAKKMSRTKREKYGKRVCEIDNQNNIICIWNSLAEAGEQTKLDRYKISNVCNGIRLTTGNRTFRFLDENNEIIEPEKKINQITEHRITKASKAVVQIDKSTDEIIQIYDNISLAAKAIQGDASVISKCCRGIKYKTHKGYKWKYLEEESFE